jgi:hypothetical protein
VPLKAADAGSAFLYARMVAVASRRASVTLWQRLRATIPFLVAPPMTRRNRPECVAAVYPITHCLGRTAMRP